MTPAVLSRPGGSGSHGGRAAASVAALVAAVLATLGVVIGAVAVVGPGAAAAVGVQTPPAGEDGAEPEATAGGGGLLTLAGCLQGSHHLAITFVFDESRSLTDNDPDGLRVTAALAALDGLTELATASGDTATQVDLEVAAFSDAYRVALPWTTLDAETAPTIRTSLSSFGSRVDGIETDIVSALSGARTSLSSRSADVQATLDRTPCKAIVLFTDGDFIVNPRSGSQAVDATKAYAPGVDLTTKEGAAEATELGRTAMCEPDGIADGLRGDGIVLLSVLLRLDDGESGDGGAGGDGGDPFLENITTGGASGDACGRISAEGSGEFLRASDTDALIVGFDEIAARVAGGTPVPPVPGLVVCGEEACPEGSQTFEVDALTRRFRVLALGPAAGVRVRISGPAGSGVVEEAGEIQVGDLTATVKEVSDRGFTLSVDRPDDEAAWVGPWTMSVEGEGDLVGQGATLQVYLFSDVQVRMAPGQFERGVATDVTAELVIPAGASADAVLQSVTGTALVEDPISGRRSTVELDGPVGGPFVGSFTTPTETTANAFLVSAELTVVTVDGATTTTRSPRSSVLVYRPTGSVQFAPAVLDLPVIEGEGSSEADLIVIGGDAEGCVWLEDATFDGGGGLSVTIDGQERLDEASCLRVPAGETLTVPVAVHASERTDATVRGVLRLHEATAGRDATVTDLQLSTSLVRGVDEAQRAVLAVLLFAGGIALPLGLLLAINAATARFQSLDVVRGAAIPVRIANGLTERTDGTIRRLRFSDRDFESLADTGNVRRFTFGGVEFRARASRNPFGVTWAQATPEGGAEKLKGGVGRRVGLDTTLAGSWLFMLDPDRTRSDREGTSEGTLLAFITEGPAAQQFDRLLIDIDNRIVKVADGLERAVRSQPPAPPKAKAKHGVESESDADPGERGSVERGPAERAPTDAPS